MEEFLLLSENAGVGVILYLRLTCKFKKNVAIITQKSFKLLPVSKRTTFLKTTFKVSTYLAKFCMVIRWFLFLIKVRLLCSFLNGLALLSTKPENCAHHVNLISINNQNITKEYITINKPYLHLVRFQE